MKNKKAATKTETLIEALEADKTFVLQSCASLVEAGYGFVHEGSDSLQHLYLISGEVYHIGKSELTRIR